MTDFMYPSDEEGVPREQVEIVDNPYPTANNNSSKVAKYVRNDQPWRARDRLLHEGESYDISQYAKITMKVYFPGAPTNDYTTQGGNIGEDWAPKTLQKSFVLRFRTGDDYLTDVGRTEDITDDKMDEWQYVEFDLSASVDKAGREKLTLQFGGEAHHNPGVFYFDDVKVYKLEEE